MSFNSDDDESPDYTPAATPKPPLKTLAGCCDTLKQCLLQPIQIVGSEKVQEMKSPFVVYCIQIGDVIVKRRYSEFESMQKILLRLYPYVVIPPMPEKQSMMDYAKLQGKAKEDPMLIKTRERRLEMFLNRVAQHPLLGAEHLFHRFLEPGNWADVLYSQKISSKKSESTSPKLTSLVGQKKLRNPDLKFLEHEQYADSLFQALTFVEKDHRKICKKIADVTELYSELGSVFNAFSLHETSNPVVTRGIEEVGQAFDSTFLATKAYVGEMQEKLADHLHEYAQFAGELKKLLHRRFEKHARWEDLGEQLDDKRMVLSNLEKDPRSSRPSLSGGGLGKLVGNIGDKIHQMMDSDPEMTRRANIARLKDVIAQLEKDREDAHTELVKFSEHTQKDVERFLQQKTKDLMTMVIMYANVKKIWFDKGAEAWQKAFNHVQTIQ